MWKKFGYKEGTPSSMHKPHAVICLQPIISNLSDFQCKRTCESDCLAPTVIKMQLKQRQCKLSI